MLIKIAGQLFTEFLFAYLVLIHSATGPYADSALIAELYAKDVLVVMCEISFLSLSLVRLTLFLPGVGEAIRAGLDDPGHALSSSKLNLVLNAAQHELGREAFEAP